MCRYGQAVYAATLTSTPGPSGGCSLAPTSRPGGGGQGGLPLQQSLDGHVLGSEHVGVVGANAEGLAGRVPAQLGGRDVGQGAFEEVTRAAKQGAVELDGVHR